ncbi:WD40-repeat-containing domain protein [Armillaria luteobubalina]|uniref:WD40-repeat-containing domain protein n=1 Tax=Armillaria luteobubalina TaxID=153913 RepID=A0AA39TBI1_9AGAR|nr:WD40-repeat-containing domain protein [Armillaria luteobubalina]
MTSPKPHYALEKTLRGHRGAVLCLSATTSGAMLASGGTDGVKLWRLDKMTKIRTPAEAGLRGAATALAWIRGEDDRGEALTFGTQAGYVVCWKQEEGEFVEVDCARLANASEITSIGFDPASNRIAIASRAGVVQLCGLDNSKRLSPIFTVSMQNHLPKTIAFSTTPKAGGGRPMITFGMHDGLICTLKSADGKVETTQNVGAKIGHAAVDLQKGVFCLDLPDEGAALYKVGDGTRIRTFPVPVKKSAQPWQVTFAEECRVVISGSDHGIVYTFDRSSEEAETLVTGNVERVQTVMATELDGTPVVIAAQSQERDDFANIYIWKKKKVSVTIPEVVKEPLTRTTNVWALFAIAAGLLLLYQNLVPIIFALIGAFGLWW